MIYAEYCALSDEEFDAVCATDPQAFLDAYDEAQPVHVEHRLLNFILRLNERLGGIHTQERGSSKASNAEIKRWIKQNSIMVNGVAMTDMNASRPEHVYEVTFFPKSKNKRVTVGIGASPQ
jgi:hypothetical protein